MTRAARPRLKRLCPIRHTERAWGRPLSANLCGTIRAWMRTSELFPILHTFAPPYSAGHQMLFRACEVVRGRVHTLYTMCDTASWLRAHLVRTPFSRDSPSPRCPSRKKCTAPATHIISPRNKREYTSTQHDGNGKEGVRRSTIVAALDSSTAMHPDLVCCKVKQACKKTPTIPNVARWYN